LRHCELFINSVRTDDEIDRLRQRYESLPAGHEEKRMTGALLVGAVVERCHKICKKLIKTHKSIKAYPHASQVPQSLLDKKQELGHKLSEYFLLISDDDLKKCPRIREPNSAIAPDAEYILAEAASEVVKAGTEGNNAFMFSKNRTNKVASAMAAIDEMTGELKKYFAQSRARDELYHALDAYADSARARACIRGADGVEYETSVINYDVDKERLNAAILENVRGPKDLCNNYVTIVENMVELREKLPNSYKIFMQNIRAAQEAIHY
jgi:hypothetical protein